MDRTPTSDKGLCRTLAAVLATLVAVVYANSLQGDFVMDDRREILHNRDIRHLWPPWGYLSGQRPFVDFTLAVNYAVGGTDVRGYHVVNVGIHVLATLALFGLVRRTLLTVPLGAVNSHARTMIAFSIALLWAVHPLQTQSVTYLIQRAESLMGLFYLLTLYCLRRGIESPHARKWFAVGILCSALGMASKGVMVTVPMVALVYDRTFSAGTFREALRRRWPVYLWLGATCLILWLCDVAPGVLSTSREVATVGFSFKGITPWQYARTQPGVILHYLQLSLWPSPLCLDYGWPVATGAAVIISTSSAVGVIVVAVARALVRNRYWGFVGVWVLLVLAPTSSVVPIKDVIFEHRMYLSLAAVMISMVFGGWAGLDWLKNRGVLSVAAGRGAAIGGSVVIAAALGSCAAARNEIYRSSVSMWENIVARRPDHERALENLGSALLREGRASEAVRWYDQAVRRNTTDAQLRSNLAAGLFQAGRAPEAVKEYRTALQMNPGLLSARCNLAHALFRMGLFDEAATECRIALAVDGTLADVHATLGRSLVAAGRWEDALTALQRACELSPKNVEARFHMALVLLQLGRSAEAIDELRIVLQLSPDHAGAAEALESLQRRR